ncbi:tRNA lysidine(34) synthetase TilS [Rhodoblastus acidophilus]|uniref:tRNA(Ile)-lysidine synthase n=1 Tax=Candidatus Rhodoblastus alkanivorans TaxID=2954117 RepID=A0ABS9Z3J8_9HYPH|nr:tRNA lysidine(34) synthetase TilS [Candidatus Rhodoblastus alkanivorans]MCI4677561.1 tRNA lysidine(34) synthetase TilS [Candidatus Rhodoblastus alkanivorans]MCI4681920.1 tRNA lysidine(34) synthetase TilS [Candidatus Rhodoblastus alkanivorans]MDI4642970.1 tRNA lysidine(34) synthetase TilS [Rhodoblastus acidophilus]
MLTQDDLDPGPLFAGFERLSGLLVAVSGGPDSLTLMRLARRWRDAGAGVALRVATVDHGLRPDSGAEAAQVGRWARELGLEHDILVWRGAKPAAGVQEKAREARYALLFDHARLIGAQAVATAHHADDQWETLLIRLARGSGIAGLSGMARDQIMRGGRLVRPLLGLSKQALIDFCRREGQDFFDDPANANPVFARARWRAVAPALHELGLTPERLEKLAERARKADEAIEWAARDVFARTKGPERNIFDLRPAEGAPQAVLERLLALIFAEIAGAAPARLERLEVFAKNLRLARENGQPLRATLGGCAARLDARGLLSLHKEKERRRGAPTSSVAARTSDFPGLPSD